MTTVARHREQDSGEYSDGSPQENDQDTSGNGGGQNDESEYDSAASDSEHSDRDPENQEAERRVDDDEDRSNPQYIPKRGTFYEHDDRTAASGGEESSNTVSETASEKKEGGEGGAERRRAGRKSETNNKWSHDKYNENEQMPKSRDELVAIYGYDIRNEDAPPHARRNRRYGRGPNKYTRTWEDEDAYKRQGAAPTPTRNNKPPNPEDFPELDAANNASSRSPRRARPRSKSQPPGGAPARPAAPKGPRRPAPRPSRAARTNHAKDDLPPLENLTITTTNNSLNNSTSQPQRKVNATVAQQRPVPTEQGKKKPLPPQQQSQQQSPAPATKAPQQQQQQKQQAPQQQQQNEARGSKRYSSLRQRPLDTYSPAQNSHHRYHEYPSGSQPSSQHQASPAPQQLPHPHQIMQQMARNAPVTQQQHGPSPPHQQLPQQQIQQQLPPQQQQLPQQQLPQQQLPQQQLPQQQMQQQQISQQHNQQQVRLGILEQQQMVSHPHHTMHNMPQHSMGQLQPAQGYAPPAMMPTQYMQVGQSGGGGAVFGGVTPLYPPPYHQPVYSHPATLPTLPHNYATSAGGVTYYSCAEQDALPRHARRPTAAIPIVRPKLADRPANSSEKDNIDRIVENMFVRKPWPPTTTVDSKDKSETRNSQEPQSKESSQPNSLTSSSISTDSKPSESIDTQEAVTEKEQEKEKETTPEKEPVVEKETESIPTDA